MVLQVSTDQFLLDIWGKLSMKIVLMLVKGEEACVTINNERAGEKLSI